MSLVTTPNTSTPQSIFDIDKKGSQNQRMIRHIEMEVLKAQIMNHTLQNIYVPIDLNIG